MEKKKRLSKALAAAGIASRIVSINRRNRAGYCRAYGYTTDTASGAASHAGSSGSNAAHE